MKHSVKKSSKDSENGTGRDHRDIKFDRFNVEAAEAYVVSDITHEHWLKQGEEKYGTDTSGWKFRCPKCGRVSCGKDFAGYNVPVDTAYTKCIGNFNKRLNCNFTAGGFFRTLGKGVVIHAPDKTIEIFPFAD